MNQALGTNSHLSKIPTASARLQACIEVLRQITPNPASILFVGDGSSSDVVGVFVASDKRSLAGPHEINKLLRYQMQARVFLPRILLGDYVDMCIKYFVVWRRISVIPIPRSLNGPCEEWWRPVGRMPLYEPLNDC